MNAITPVAPAMRSWAFDRPVGRRIVGGRGPCATAVRVGVDEHPDHGQDEQQR